MAAKDEVAMNVDVPPEIKEEVEKTALRLRLAGDKDASMKRVVSGCLAEFLAAYEKAQLERIQKGKKR